MSLIAEPKTPVLPASPRVLLVEDEPAVLELLETALSRELDCRIRSATTVREARRILATQQIDPLVADVGLPDGDGLSLIKALRSRQPFAQAIVITGSPTVQGTIEAMRGGAAARSGSRSWATVPDAAAALRRRIAGDGGVGQS